MCVAGSQPWSKSFFFPWSAGWEEMCSLTTWQLGGARRHGTDNIADVWQPDISRMVIAKAPRGLYETLGSWRIITVSLLDQDDKVVLCLQWMTYGWHGTWGFGRGANLTQFFPNERGKLISTEGCPAGSLAAFRWSAVWTPASPVKLPVGNLKTWPKT